MDEISQRKREDREQQWAEMIRSRQSGGYAFVIQRDNLIFYTRNLFLTLLAYSRFKFAVTVTRNG